MYASGKKRASFFVKTKYKARKCWKPEKRILKSGIQSLMESGIHSVKSGIQDSLGLPYMGRYIPLTQSHESTAASVAAAVVVVEMAKGASIHTGNKFGANGSIEICVTQRNQW